MLGLLTPALAADIVDQEQPIRTPTPIAIGGESDQKIAQTFTVGMTGPMSGIRLPVGCGSGELIVEIMRFNANGEPEPPALARVVIPAADLGGDPGIFRTIRFEPPLPVTEGDELAIVLTNPSGYCSILSGPPGDSYAGGSYLYDSRPSFPGWIGSKTRPLSPDSQGDIPFQTLIDDGMEDIAGRCVGNFAGGSVTLPISAYTPLCRCLSDASLNEFRCTLTHPDFFIVRRIPQPPFKPGVIVEEWACTPLTRLEAPLLKSVEVGGKLQVHAFGKTSKPGTFETLRLKRSLKDPGLTRPGVVGFKYRMKGGKKPVELEFGFDPSFEPDGKQ